MIMERKLSKICTSYNSLIFAALISSLLTLSACKAEEITSSALTPAVVVDGDSLEIGSARIRLIGIDAPEYQQYCKNRKNKKYNCGKKAKDYLKKLIGTDTITCKVQSKDKYDRYLCVCYVNKTDINAEMILSGNAVTYVDTTYENEEKIAKKEKRGLWKGRFMQPRLFRKLKEEQQK